jgi:hypothetical protein
LPHRIGLKQVDNAFATLAEHRDWLVMSHNAVYDSQL